MAKELTSEVLAIYYTGSSRSPSGTDIWEEGYKAGGDWISADKLFYSLERVLELIHKTGFNKKVKIVTTCNYSGSWPMQAKNLWKKKATHKYLKDVATLEIESSCDGLTDVPYGKYRQVQKKFMKCLDNEAESKKAVKYFDEAHVPYFGFHHWSSEGYEWWDHPKMKGVKAKDNQGLFEKFKELFDFNEYEKRTFMFFEPRTMPLPPVADYFYDHRFLDVIWKPLVGTDVGGLFVKKWAKAVENPVNTFYQLWTKLKTPKGDEEWVGHPETNTLVCRVELLTE